MRNINLLPEAHRPIPNFIVKRFLNLLIVCILIFSIVIAFASLWMRIESYNKAASNKRETIEFLEQRVAANQEESARLQNIKELVSSIEDIEQADISKVEILDDLQRSIPTAVTITNLSLSPGSITLEGKTTDLKTVALLLKSLNSWDKYNNFSIPQLSIVEGQYVFQAQGNLRGGE